MPKSIAVRRAAIAAVATAALGAAALAPPAGAQGPTLPLEVHGVRADQAASGGPVRITFGKQAAARYRRVAGRTVVVRCNPVFPPTAPVLLRQDRVDELVATLKAPAARRTLVARGGKLGYDVCQVTALRPRGGTVVTALSLTLPVTQDGAAYLRDAALGNRMVALLDLLPANATDGIAYPSYATLAAFFPRIVQLATADASPPAGRLGYYTDGAQHATVVAVGVLGWRYVIDANGPTLTSNLPQLVAES